MIDFDKVITLASNEGLDELIFPSGGNIERNFNTWLDEQLIKGTKGIVKNRQSEYFTALYSYMGVSIAFLDFSRLR